MTSDFWLFDQLASAVLHADSFPSLKSKPILCSKKKPKESPRLFEQELIIDLQDWYLPRGPSPRAAQAARTALSALISRVDSATGADGYLSALYEAVTAETSANRIHTLHQFYQKYRSDLVGEGVKSRILLAARTICQKHVQTDEPLVGDTEATQIFEELQRRALGDWPATSVESLLPDMPRNQKVNALERVAREINFAARGQAVPPLHALVFGYGETTASSVGALLHEYLYDADASYARTARETNDAEALDAIIRNSKLSRLIEQCRSYEKPAYADFKGRLFNTKKEAYQPLPRWLYEASWERRIIDQLVRGLIDFLVWAWRGAVSTFERAPKVIADHLVVVLFSTLFVSALLYFGLQHFAEVFRDGPRDLTETPVQESLLQPLNATPVHRFEALEHGPVKTIRLSNSGGQFVSISEDGSALVWDIPGRRRQARLRGRGFVSAKFDPTDRIIITSSADGTISLWDATTGASAGRSWNRYSAREIRAFVRRDYGQHHVADLAVGADRIFSGGSDGFIHIVSARMDGAQPSRLEPLGQKKVSRPVLLADSYGSQIIMADIGGALYYTATGFADAQEAYIKPGARSRPVALRVLRSNGHVMAAYSNGMLDLIDPASWRRTPIIVETGLTAADLSYNNDWGAISTKNDLVFIAQKSDGSWFRALTRPAYDVQSPTAHSRQTSPGEPVCCRLSAIAIATDGGSPSVLTAGDDGRVVLWHVSVGKE